MAKQWDTGLARPVYSREIQREGHKPHGGSEWAKLNSLAILTGGNATMEHQAKSVLVEVASRC